MQPVRGFKVKRFRELLKLRSLTITPSVPFDLQKNCPTCSTPLQCLCTLISGDDRVRIRIGLCARCGYLGYINRPTKEWMVNFYSTQWDQARIPIRKLEDGHKVIATLVAQLQLDKTRPLLEIGCGYGALLQHFSNQGFQQVMGVDNSEHRAETARKLFGLPVFAGNFEHPSIQQHLQKKAPFSLIYSNHVIEHVYHPTEIIAAAARLQEEGDILALAFPNVAGEHTGFHIFYLPHIHGFTKESMEYLLNQHGYEIFADHSPHQANIILSAKKVSHVPVAFFSKNNLRTETTIQKFRNGLALTTLQHPGLHSWWWEPREKIGGGDRARMVSIPVPLGVEKFWWFLAPLRKRINAYLFRRFPPGYSALIEPIEKYHTTSLESPFEIQFSNNIELLIK